MKQLITNVEVSGIPEAEEVVRNLQEKVCFSLFYFQHFISLNAVVPLVPWTGVTLWDTAVLAML